jgi:hypothetical protein
MDEFYLHISVPFIDFKLMMPGVQTASKLFEGINVIGQSTG